MKGRGLGIKISAQRTKSRVTGVRRQGHSCPEHKCLDSAKYDTLSSRILNRERLF